MKKITLIVALMLAFGWMAKSQMIEDFEHIKLNVMVDEQNPDDDSFMVVVPNPDTGEEPDPGDWVVEFHRSQHGFPWSGFWSALAEPVDLTENKYVHVRVWKTRISPIRFKIEGGAGGDLEIESMEPQTLTEEWEDIVFDFSERSGTWPTIAFMPDFEDPLELDEDITIYFDRIMVNNDPTPGSEPVIMIEDFDMIPMTLMLNGEEDNSRLRVVPNPDMEGENTSEHVAEFLRSMRGHPWGGFFAPLDEPLDFSENQYIYVDVWKSRISPLRFKIEGGPTDPIEIESMEPQTLVEEWETIVFDFSAATGAWTTIVFMPDFMDPVGLTEDIIIYFDNIRQGGAPAVSVPDLPQEGRKVVIYPNPARDFITIQHEDMIQSVEVIDLTGRTVLVNENINNKRAQVNLTGYNNGIYIVRVFSESGISNHKIRLME